MNECLYLVQTVLLDTNGLLGFLGVLRAGVDSAHLSVLAADLAFLLPHLGLDLLLSVLLLRNLLVVVIWKGQRDQVIVRAQSMTSLSYWD